MDNWMTRRQVRSQPFRDYSEPGLQKLLDAYDTAMKRLNGQYLRMMGEHIREVDENTFDYKTRLQEYVQADSRKSISYETLSVVGPNNAPEFKVAVKIDGLTYGVGTATTKKQAQKNAAKDALEKLAQL